MEKKREVKQHTKSENKQVKVREVNEVMSPEQNRLLYN
jgi:hypothetical protein